MTDLEIFFSKFIIIKMLDKLLMSKHIYICTPSAASSITSYSIFIQSWSVEVGILIYVILHSGGIQIQIQIHDRALWHPQSSVDSEMVSIKLDIK